MFILAHELKDGTLVGFAEVKKTGSVFTAIRSNATVFATKSLAEKVAEQYRIGKNEVLRPVKVTA